LRWNKRRGYIYIERYNKDGSLSYCKEYYNGIENGIYESWDDHGNLESFSGYYQNGKKVKDLEGNEPGVKQKGKERGCTIM